MPTTHLTPDYLVLGAGAMSMGFVDVVLADDPTATFVIVDRHANPGGHWNDAYPFVRLHQPAVFYGLHSTELGKDKSDLSSGANLLAYFRDAMDRFVRTGRVQFLPMSEHRGDGTVVSLVDHDQVTVVTPRRRIVDGTYMQVTVPSVCPPRYEVAADVTLIPPNGLATLREPHDRYCIVGAGKTGIDAILFLLNSGVAAERIQWIVPNDAWLMDRDAMRPAQALGTVLSMMQSVTESATIEDAFRRLEREGIIFRFDESRTPTKWRCATVNRTELPILRQVTDVVRLGHVRALGSDKIELDDGTVEVAADTLFVDCTANGLVAVDPKPLFAPGLVTLQSVFMCQQTFSASLIGRLERLPLSDAERNELCVAVPHPELPHHLAGAMVATAGNLLRCTRRVGWWLRRNRLYFGHHAPLPRYLATAARLARLQGRAEAAAAAMTPTA